MSRNIEQSSFCVYFLEQPELGEGKKKNKTQKPTQASRRAPSASLKLFPSKMRWEPGDQPQQHGCKAEVCKARRVNQWPPSRGLPADCSAAGSPTGAAIIKALSTSSSWLYTL